MALLRIHLTGSSIRFHADVNSGVVDEVGILGLDVSPKTIDGSQYSVVQLIVDDSNPSGQQSLLDAPLTAEMVANGEEGQRSVARELFDHDAFRKKLRAEHDAGESTTRGVLLRTDGELPDKWIRLAFLPVALKLTAGMDLVVNRTTVEELVAGVESAYADGALTDDERRDLLISIEQHHPA